MYNNIIKEIEENGLKYNIGFSQGEYNFTFFVLHNNKIATAEFSIISDEAAIDYIDLMNVDNQSKLNIKDAITESKDYYFFSRLIVPKELRGMGIATNLMKEVINYSKKENVFLINTVNPYGDLNLEQLNNFYEKNGMYLVNNEGLLLYSKNINKDQINLIKEDFNLNQNIDNQIRKIKL